MNVSNNIEDLLAKHFLGGTNPSEEQVLEQWIAEHQDEYLVHKELWEGIESIDLPINETKAWESIKAKQSKAPLSTNQPKGRKRSLFSRLAIAASVAILMGAAGYFTMLKPTVYKTTAETKQVQLKDGSEVLMNSNTTLTVAKSFNKKERRVTLAGEAFFEVTKDPAKTFTVETNDFDVKVVGTSFNVLATSTAQEVLVQSGIVSVSSKGGEGRTVIMKKGDFLNFAESPETVVQTEDENYMSWKTNTLTFTDASIEDVKNALERHFSEPVDMTAIKLDCNLTATFTEQELSEVLAIIKTVCSGD